MKKMTDKDKKLLYFLAAIILVAASYFFVFQKFSERTEELKTTNTHLQKEVSTLETMVAGKQNVVDNTAEKQEEIAEVLSNFPTEVRTQNAIYNLNKMYESIDGVTIQSEGYTMNQLFYQPEPEEEEKTEDVDGEEGDTAAADETSPTPAATPVTPDPSFGTTGTAITADTPTTEIVEAAANYFGFRSDVAVAFTAPYDSLKKVVDFINNSEERMTITEISATKAEDSNALNCSMTVSMYAITGTGESYSDLDIGGDNPSAKDIFRGK